MKFTLVSIFSARIAAAALATIVMSRPVAAADALLNLSVSRAELAAIHNWNGSYIGGHIGYARGRTNTAISDTSANPDNSNARFGALYGGGQVGYNYLSSSRMLLGIEADVSLPNYLSNDAEVWSKATTGGTTSTTDKIDFIGTVRGRVGYAYDNWIAYATSGLAFTQERFLQGDPGNDEGADKHVRMRTGWAVGGGIEAAIDRNWSMRLEYLYSHFGTANVIFGSGTRFTSAIDLYDVRLGLNRKLVSQLSFLHVGGDLPSAPELNNWEVHGQTTYIQQGYPGFRSSYYGANSLTPWAQTRETWTVSAFFGLRLWEGGELYYNPELFQGFGFADTAGVAGFPNGEAQKSQFQYPHYNTSRLFLRQTFGLGGEQDAIESSYGQMAGKSDVSRLTFQIGKFAVKDLFDNNAYASDPRVHFMNWSIWAGGAFDYPADKVGMTYGATAELNQKDWALRTGYFLVGNVPNANQFDMNLFTRGGYVTELETRYALFGRLGKLRATGWLHETFSGGYRDALSLVAANSGLDPTDAIVQTRRSRTKYGYILNVEQTVTDQIGVFGRWSWNNGKNEDSAFTDIDSSLSFGASIHGVAWGRPNDTFGLAGAINGLSKDHRNYLAVGGLGILIGDGQLNYSREKVFETYYAFNVLGGTTVTFDYQLIAAPAYNADRGPVSVFSGRLHATF